MKKKLLILICFLGLFNSPVHANSSSSMSTQLFLLGTSYVLPGCVSIFVWCTHIWNSRTMDRAKGHNPLWYLYEDNAAYKIASFGLTTTASIITLTSGATMRGLNAFNGASFFGSEPVHQNNAINLAMHSAAREFISANIRLSINQEREFYFMAMGTKIFFLTTGANYPYFIAFTLINTASKVHVAYNNGEYNNATELDIGLDVALAMGTSALQAYTDMRWMIGFDNTVGQRIRMYKGTYGSEPLASFAHQDVEFRDDHYLKGEYWYLYGLRGTEFFSIIANDLAWVSGRRLLYKYAYKSSVAIDDTSWDQVARTVVGSSVYQSVRISGISLNNNRFLGFRTAAGIASSAVIGSPAIASFQ